MTPGSHHQYWIGTSLQAVQSRQESRNPLGGLKYAHSFRYANSPVTLGDMPKMFLDRYTAGQETGWIVGQLIFQPPDHMRQAVGGSRQMDILINAHAGPFDLRIWW